MIWEIKPMKMLVETSGKFMLSDMTVAPAQEIVSRRPSVVQNSHFVQQRVSLGQVQILGELNDDATDEEFQAYWKESETAKQAVAAFLSSFGKDVETTKEKQPEAETEAPSEEEQPEVEAEVPSEEEQQQEKPKRRGRPKKSQA